jgi:glycosyltransferase involved in cell wall biosynthesis
MARQYRIGFDARLAGQKHAGIGRYSEELLRALVQESGNHTLWIVFTYDKDQLPWLEKYSNIQRRVVPVRHYTIREQLVLPRIFSDAKLDLLHVPHFNVPILYRGKFVVTIHDLLWHRRRDAGATTLSPWVYRIKFHGYKFVSEQAIQRAEKIFVPTQTVAKEVQEILPHVSSLAVTSEGLSESFLSISPPSKKSSPQKNSPPYCVYTGSLYPHKNVEVIFEALKSLPQMKVKLVSSRGVFTDDTLARAQALGVAKQVEWLGYQTDEELIELYQNAVALIQPSFSEGFGLTGLEAMAAGCSVIASDIPVFHEVYKNFASYFDPHISSQLRSLLQEKLSAAKDYTHLQKAQKYAQGFTWESVAKSVWNGYQAVLDQSE